MCPETILSKAQDYVHCTMLSRMALEKILGEANDYVQRTVSRIFLGIIFDQVQDYVHCTTLSGYFLRTIERAYSTWVQISDGTWMEPATLHIFTADWLNEMEYCVSSEKGYANYPTWLEVSEKP